MLYLHLNDSLLPFHSILPSQHLQKQNKNSTHTNAKPQRDTTTLHYRMAIFNRTNSNKCLRGCGGTSAGGKINLYNHYGKQEVPQKIENRITIQSSNLASGYLLPKLENV